MTTKQIDAIDDAVEWLVETGAPPKLIGELQDIVRVLEREYRNGSEKKPRQDGH